MILTTKRHKAHAEKGGTFKDTYSKTGVFLENVLEGCLNAGAR